MMQANLKKKFLKFKNEVLNSLKLYFNFISRFTVGRVQESFICM